jgi:hypothetical protein
MCVESATIVSVSAELSPKNAAAGGLPLGARALDDIVDDLPSDQRFHAGRRRMSRTSGRVDARKPCRATTRSLEAPELAATAPRAGNTNPREREVHRVAVVVSKRPRLRGRHRVGAFLYACVAIVSLVLGAIYLFRDSFMPYHADALSKDWSELDPATQTLIKSLMEVAAAGWLALGVLVLLLVAIPIRRGERWARFAAPAALLLFYVPTLLATLTVLYETPASPPWRFNLVACLCAVVGFLVDAPWRSATETAREDA